VREIAESLVRSCPGDVENVVCLGHVDSTQAFCLRLMEQIDEQGFGLGPTVVIAGRQTLGRGRRNRRWESPTGGLYLSWVRSGVAAHAIGRLPMLTAAAAYRAISECGVVDAGIKWPNDIVVNGKKLAGILIHVRGGEAGWVIVGLGVNLATAPEVSRNSGIAATAMAELIEPAPLERWRFDLTNEFIASLSRFLGDTDPALDLWRRRLIHRAGERLSVRLSGGKTLSGTFQGLTAEGFLRLGTSGGERIITSGDIFETG
jgi:BirA family biotin operon repressor/biotin-[acetyl-CoA-carboxylase] ligase